MECTIESKIYGQGDLVCDEKLCYECKDGFWREKGALEMIERVRFGG